MKRLFWFTLSGLIMLALVACGGATETRDGYPAGDISQEIPNPASDAPAYPVATGAPGAYPGDLSAAGCPDPAAGQAAFADFDLGLCFVYPDRYQAQLVIDGSLSLFVDSIQNVEAPLAQISVEPANGRALADAVAERLAVYGLPDSQPPQATQVGGQPAFLLANLPGQDINNRYMVLADGRLYDLIIYRTSPDYGPIAAEAQALTDTLLNSLVFMPSAS